MMNGLKTSLCKLHISGIDEPPSLLRKAQIKKNMVEKHRIPYQIKIVFKMCLSK